MISKMLNKDPKTVYIVFSVLRGLAYSIIFTLEMVYQVEMVGLTPLQLVLTGTALEISSFIFEIPTGVVADVYSRRLSSIIGVFIVGLAFVFQGLIPTFLAMLVTSAFWGLGWTFTSGAESAWVADEIGVDQVGPTLLRASQYSRAGGLVGIPIAVALGRIGLNLPVVIGGALMFTLGFLLIAFMPERNFTPRSTEERETWGTMVDTFSEGIKLVRGQAVLILFLVIGLFAGMYSEGFDRLWTKHFIDNFTFPTILGLDSVSWFGVMRVGTILFGFAANEFIRRRWESANADQTVRLLQGLYGGMVVALFTFAWTGNFWVALGVVWAFDTLRGLTHPVTSHWVNQYIESKVRATVISVASQVDALGQMMGGPGVGAIGSYISIRAALTTSAVILSPVVVLFHRARKKAKQGRAA